MVKNWLGSHLIQSSDTIQQALNRAALAPSSGSHIPIKHARSKRATAWRSMPAARDSGCDSSAKHARRNRDVPRSRKSSGNDSSAKHARRNRAGPRSGLSSSGDSSAKHARSSRAGPLQGSSGGDSSAKHAHSKRAGIRPGTSSGGDSSAKHARRKRYFVSNKLRNKTQSLTVEKKYSRNKIHSRNKIPSPTSFP